MFKVAKIALFSAALALSAMTAVEVAGAYQVSPMIYELKPSGAGATVTLRVQNDEGKPITIELVAEKREFDENGKESRTPADADFVLFPPQAVIQAGKAQAVRIQYVGDAKLDRSVMYVITVKQVPVQLPTDATSGVQFVFNFGTVAHVVPDGAKADVQVASITPASGGGYQLRLRNAGNKYANLAGGTVTLSGGGSTVPLTGDDWRKLIGPSWLLPGHDRVITIPADKRLSGTVSARFEAGAREQS